MSFNSDWPPYSYGEGRSVQGILPALMTEIVEKRMGMKISHYGYPWNRAQRAVETGKLDTMVTVPTESRFAFSRTSGNTVYTIEMRAVVARGSAAEQEINAALQPKSLRKLRLCDIMGNGWGERFAAKNNLKPIISSKMSSCLRMTANGRTDVTIQSVAVANQGIAANGLGDELAILPPHFGAMSFTLLLSNKSVLDANFMADFDKTIGAMIADGSYDALVDRLRSAATQ